MGIWAEIKKAINSNLSLPLNEKIDRDIEENRIGHGFVTPSMPSFKNNPCFGMEIKQSFIGSGSNNEDYQHLHYLNNKFYMFGSSSSYVYTLSDMDGSLTNVGNTPYVMDHYGTSFVYNGYIFIVGGLNGQSSFYKSNNGAKWSSVASLPSSLLEGTSIVYKDVAYIWNQTAKTFYKYSGGNTLSSINFGVDILTDNIDNMHPFIMDNKLYFATNGGVIKNGSSESTIFFTLDESVNKILLTSDIPTCFLDYPGSTALFFQCPDRKLIMMTNGGSLYCYRQNIGWLELGCKIKATHPYPSSYGTYCPPATSSCIMLDDCIYYMARGLHNSCAILCKISYDFYREAKYLLPRNTIISIPDVPEDAIIPIENCTVLSDETVKALKDGNVSFRIKNYANYDAMFR